MLYKTPAINSNIEWERFHYVVVLLMKRINLANEKPADVKRVSIFFIPKPLYRDLTPYMFVACTYINELTKSGTHVTVVLLSSVCKGNMGISDAECKKLTTKMTKNMFQMGLNESPNLIIREDIEFSDINIMGYVFSASKIEEIIYKYAVGIVEHLNCDAILDTASTAEQWEKAANTLVTDITFLSLPHFKDISNDYMKFNVSCGTFLQKCNRLGSENKRILNQAMKIYLNKPGKSRPFLELSKETWTKINKSEICRLSMFVDISNIAKVAAVLSSETRIKILRMVSDGGDYTRNIAKRSGVPPSFVAYHLKLLKEIGIIDEKVQKNKKIYYSPYTDIHISLKRSFDNNVS